MCNASPFLIRGVTGHEKFHAAFLSSSPLKSIDYLPEIEGAGGQAVPYPGYVKAILTFPGTVSGTEVELEVDCARIPF